MRVSDSQVHIWGPNTPERPWPEGGEARAHRNPPIGVVELIREMDAAGVDRTVIVPPSWEGDRNDLALAAAADYPNRIAIMGRLNLNEPGASDLVRTWRDQPGMLGLRLTFPTPAALQEAEWIWSAAESARLPVMVMAPGQTPALGSIAERHPRLRMIFDHLNINPPTKFSEIGPAIEPLLALGGIPNVAVKVSALPCHTDEGYPFSTLAPHVRRVVDAFGAERCMWGSDLSRLPCPYGDWVKAMAEGLGCLTPSEVEWIMGATLAHWLDWPDVSH